ncbi:precorrin-4 C(11)-methyltransferase [Desulfovibrio ferrophilus]|uniref:Precorrin-4 C(11)-methyltransferase n=1 Tax=Desulfovibrio ferrophilus TaxID=241368 RepID=A0A2Z6B3D6_9BACT|nr:precorrin-4 C(11)-methyltransferase [Desulfovibrio ferrophilus]BBD10012.1 precorrin-4 C(11)-methyltransferase [Desulfovibrio ferrophilus]
MASVYFIGAGPGDPELITVKGRRLICEADLVLYAGSLVPSEVVACAREDARVEDSSSLTLDQTHALLAEAVERGGMVARVHTGDPSLYGAVQEQARLLDRDGISWEIVPGVTAAFAAAAMAGESFTVPERVQSLVVTRAPGRTAVPDGEELAAFAAHGCSMAIYLSTSLAQSVQAQLLEGGLTGDTPVVVVHRAGWPDGEVLRTTLEKLSQDVEYKQWTRQAVFLVLPGKAEKAPVSRLYDPSFAHGWRDSSD